MTMAIINGGSFVIALKDEKMRKTKPNRKSPQSNFQFTFVGKRCHGLGYIITGLTKKQMGKMFAQRRP